MSRIKYRQVVRDAQGDATADALITVRNAAGTLATIYDAASGGSALGNGTTFVSGDGTPEKVGAFEFWIDAVDQGPHTITVGAGGSADTFPVMLINHPPKDFASRPTLVTAWDDGLYPDGTVVADGTVSYVAVSGSTVIPDLPGLVPFDPSGEYDAFVEHFMATSVTGSSNITAAMQIAVDYIIDIRNSSGALVTSLGGILGLKSRSYSISDVNADGYGVIIDDSITIRGTGYNSTTLNIGIAAETAFDTTMFYVGKGEAAIAADTSNTAVVRAVAFEGIQFKCNATAPIGGAFILADRSSVEVRSCQMTNHFIGFEMLGNPQNCRFIDSQIFQGSNQYPILRYDNETANFTVGETVTGAGGGSGVVVSISDSGTAGILVLSGWNGTLFVDNEALTGSVSGIAVVNGVLSSKVGSCGIKIDRRQVNEALAASIAYAQDVTLAYDNITNALVVGSTVIGATSGASATVIADTGSVATLAITNLLDFEDNEELWSGAGGTGTQYAVANGVNSARSYWTEPNSVWISNSNIEMGALPGQYGGEYAVLLTCYDTVSFQSCHIGFGTTACIGIIPAQRNISVGDLRVEGGLIDPLPGKTQYGIRIADDNAVGPTTIVSVGFSNVAVAGVTLGTGLLCTIPVKRLNLMGVEFKQCGKHAVFLNNANCENVTMMGCHFFFTNQLALSTPAVQITDGQRIIISGCNFDTGFRGLQIGDSADRVTITGNTFNGMSDGKSIFLGATPGKITCYGNDIQEDDTIASAAALAIPIGMDKINVTGNTNINSISAAGMPPYNGREVKLVFSDNPAPTVTLAGNILTGATAATQYDVMHLMYDEDAAKWLGVSFKAN